MVSLCHLARRLNGKRIMKINANKLYYILITNKLFKK
jgi:hypothetical protein